MAKQTESTRFLETMKLIVSVPKAEIDRREAAWRGRRRRLRRPLKKRLAA
jgi:hypothetical protein